MTRRTYGEACCLAHALDVVGDRWTLLIVRELLLAPRRYNELLADLPGIGTNLLAERLRHLESAGVIERPAAERGPYRLTDHGRTLQDAVFGLARFGLRTMPDPGDGGVFRPRWAVLALRAMVDASRAPDPAETYEFVLGRETLHVNAGRDGVEVAPGPAAEPVLRLRAEPLTFLRIGTRHLDPLAALAQGAVEAEGDLAAMGRLVHLLALASPVRPA